MSKNNKAFTIIVAEDDPAISEVVSLILREEGYSVQAIDDGTEIISTIRERKADLLLLDISLKGRNGANICKQVKSDEKVQHIPIVLLSANVDISSIATDVGADDFLRKPFEIEELLEKVRKYQLL